MKQVFAAVFCVTLLAAPALSQTPVKQAGQSSAGQGSGMQMQCLMDLIKSMIDMMCHMQKPPKPCPSPPAGMMAMIGMNAGCMGGSQKPQKSGKAAAVAAGGFDVPDFSDFELPPGTDTVFSCDPRKPGCNTLTPEAQAALDALPALALDFPLEGGQSGEEAAGMVNRALADMGGTGSAVNAELPTPNPGATIQAKDDGARAATAAATPSFKKSGDGSDSGGSDGEEEFRKRALALGTLVPANSLQSFKPDGSEASIWERATRRFLGTASGQEGMRAFVMARTESIRRQALRYADRAPVGTPTAQSGAPAAAPRPASVVTPPSGGSKH